MSEQKTNNQKKVTGKMNRRAFLAGSITAVGVGAMGLTGPASLAMKPSQPGRSQTGLKYEVKSIRLLAENGGQTDWAKHDPEQIVYCRQEADRHWDVWTIRTGRLRKYPDHL